jgi:hypothetical protein
MKYFFGVISKNQIDSIIEYSFEHPSTEITLIPSRRQIEYNGGYVNNWTTATFSQYIKESNLNIKIERDHSGPGQGLYDDDGYESLAEDCKYFDIIHIDPWKKYPNLHDGIQWTIDMIQYCYNLNPNMLYEIGTEEAIRPFSAIDLETVIITIKNRLDEHVFKKIKYCVVQCGNSLCNGKNSGLFDENKLTEMVTLVNRYNLISKEHNGDWVSIKTIKEKEKLGLECINIAPEFGMIESTVILDFIKKNKNHYEKVYNLCYESGKWKKWISDDFDFENQKDELILITCHYIFSNDEFQIIKQFYKDIDIDIKTAFLDKLLLLNFIYEIRDKCIFCTSINLTTLFDKNYKTSLSLGMYNNINNESYFMPYNVIICNECNSTQNKYIGDLSIVYDSNHIDDYGTTKNKKHERFCNFISDNTFINGIVEVGSCNGVLANKLLTHINTDYTIIEPSYIGSNSSIKIIKDYFENVDLININANTIIMSDVFEHFYNPIDILNKIKNSPNIKYIYLNHPDFDYSIKNDIYINLNCEHTFLIEHQFLFNLFNNYGFRLTRNHNFENFSLFIEFEKMQIGSIIETPLYNYNTNAESKKYFLKLIHTVSKINFYMHSNFDKNFYIWPMSIHSIPLFTMGLNYKKLSGILDNSPNKIGKYMYGYNLLCSSLDELIQNGTENDCVFISGAGNYIKELDLSNTKIKIIFINEL